MKRFFIIGNPRSGTTLLRLMLNKHSNITVPPEAGFLVWLHKDFSDFTFSDSNVKVFMDSLNKTLKIENWNLDFHVLENYIKEQKPSDYPQLIDCVYRFYSIFNLKKNVQIFGDKNNFYLNEIDLLHRLYPEAKFIHIIRDGRSVAVSYKELNQKSIDSKYAPKLPNDMESIAEEWVQNIEKIEASFSAINDDLHHTIKFEELIEKPEDILRDICVFLEIDYDEEMLNYFRTTQNDGLEPDDFLQWKSKNLMPLQKDEAKKYTKLSPDELRAFERNAENILSKYQYI